MPDGSTPVEKEIVVRVLRERLKPDVTEKSEIDYSSPFASQTIVRHHNLQRRCQYILSPGTIAGRICSRCTKITRCYDRAVITEHEPCHVKTHSAKDLGYWWTGTTTFHLLLDAPHMPMPEPAQLSAPRYAYIFKRWRMQVARDKQKWTARTHFACKSDLFTRWRRQIERAHACAAGWHHLKQGSIEMVQLLPTLDDYLYYYPAE